MEFDSLIADRRKEGSAQCRARSILRRAPRYSGPARCFVWVAEHRVATPHCSIRRLHLCLAPSAAVQELALTLLAHRASTLASPLFFPRFSISPARLLATMYSSKPTFRIATLSRTCFRRRLRGKLPVRPVSLLRNGSVSPRQAVPLSTHSRPFFSCLLRRVPAGRSWGVPTDWGPSTAWHVPVSPCRASSDATLHLFSISVVWPSGR